MNRQQQKLYDRQVKDAAHSHIVKTYQDAMEITNGVYCDILRAMRDEIDQILARNE